MAVSGGGGATGSGAVGGADARGVEVGIGGPEGAEMGVGVGGGGAGSTVDCGGIGTLGARVGPTPGVVTTAAAVGAGGCIGVASAIGDGGETSSKCVAGREVGFDVESVVAVGFSPCNSSFRSCRV